MGIANTEQEILDELKKLAEEPEPEEIPTEELLKEVDEELKEPEEELEELEEIEEEEELEEDLRPAQKRHALKELKAEKEAKALMEKELNELKIAYARQQGREDANKPTEAAEEIPDRDYEPEKYALYKTEQLEKKLLALEEKEARIMAERQWEKLQSQRVKSNPDFMDAKAYLLEGEAKRIKALYPNATESQIETHIKQQEYQTVANAARAGMDPLAQIEFLAWQAGFRGKDKEEKEVEAEKKGANIQNIKRNIKKSASLIGGSSGGKVGDFRTADQLAAMTIDEIHKFGRAKYEAAIQKLEGHS